MLAGTSQTVNNGFVASGPAVAMALGHVFLSAADAKVVDRQVAGVDIIGVDNSKVQPSFLLIELEREGRRQSGQAQGGQDSLSNPHGLLLCKVISKWRVETVWWKKCLIVDAGRGRWEVCEECRMNDKRERLKMQ